MSSTKLQVLAFEMTYNDVSKMLSSLVSKHKKRSGGDWWDLWGVAAQAFVEAYHSYDPQYNSSFSTWVYNRVTYALKDEARDRIKRQNKETTVNDLPDKGGMNKKKLDDQLEGISDNARFVIQLILGESPDLPMIYLERRIKKKTPQKIRAALRQCLLEMGWDTDKITVVFHEIRRAIQ